MSSREGKVKRVFLWTCLRSCSSAFTRSIMSLSKVQVISEPFKFAYYFGPERQSRRYEARAVDQTMSYESMARSILNRGIGDATDVIFVKDMAYYLKGRLGMLEEWFHDAKHSFLIRDPNKAILSQYRVSENPAIQSSGWDYFEPDEAGYQELHEMYEYVKKISIPTL